MKIIVIGGTEHIGSFLCPMLVAQGHDVTCLTRGVNRPYNRNEAWNKVRMLQLDRSQTSPETFSSRISGENAEVVIDLISFHLKDIKAMVAALEGHVLHYIYCSSCWAEGRTELLPVNPDNADKEPLCKYGRQKYASEQYLLAAWRERKFPATIIMPGQISGAGWTIINPWGNRLSRCIDIIRNGEKLMLPNFGMETVHHVHASDVARLFACATMHREKALGEKFYAVSGGSITLYGYARLLYKHFGREPHIGFLSWDEWQKYVRSECAGTATEEEIEMQLTESYLHLTRSGFFGIEKEHCLLGYTPEYSNVETILEAVDAY